LLLGCGVAVAQQQKTGRRPESNDPIITTEPPGVALAQQEKLDLHVITEQYLRQFSVTWTDPTPTPPSLVEKYLLEHPDRADKQIVEYLRKKYPNEYHARPESDRCGCHHHPLAALPI
jgi:hypothetical protein